MSRGPVSVLQKRRMDELKAHPPANVRTDLQCPDCGSLLTLRVGRFGRFYGCPRFPKCWGTWNADDDGNPIGQPTGRKSKTRYKIRAAEESQYFLKKFARKHSYLLIAQEALRTADQMDTQTAQIVLSVLQGSVPRNRWERLTSEIF